MDGVWLFVFGLMYFRAIETSQRNVALWRDANDAGVDDANAANAVFSAPKLSVLQPRGVFFAVLLASPGLAAPLGLADHAYRLLVTLSFGAFLSAILPPTENEPEPDDLRMPWRVPIKWGFAKLDQTLKAAIGLLIVGVLTLIPVVGGWLQAFGDAVFAVVPGTPISSWFADLAFGDILFNNFVRAAPVLLVLGVWVRMSSLAGANSVIATFLISIPAIFVGYQAMLNAAAKAGRSFPDMPESLLSALAVDFLGCCIGLLGGWFAQTQRSRSRSRHM